MGNATLAYILWELLVSLYLLWIPAFGRWNPTDSMSFPVVLGGIAILVALWLKGNSRNRPPLPPGPPADPILGHLRHIVSEHEEKQFYDWGKIYGDVIHLSLLGQSVIVLNSVQAATDLLDKRSAIYSDRPQLMSLKLLGFADHALPLMPYGKTFQRHRRMLHQHLLADRAISYRPTQLREAYAVLKSLLENGVEWEKVIQRYSTAIIMDVAFGHQVTSDDDIYVKLAEEAEKVVNNAGSGGSPMDVFPFLRYFPSWFPGAYYAGYARDNRKVIEEVHNYPFEQMQRAIASGTAKPCFLSYHLEGLNREGEKYPYSAEDIKGASGMLYLAAADTTYSSLSTFFLAMVLYPDCQLKAQKEIDDVIGSERLPDFSDRGSLPYLDCLVQETLRWNNAAPMGVPHRSTEDDIYKGMFIPKGSIVIPNTRGMTLDERIYVDPTTFNPSRYLPKPDGNGEPFPVGPFGFGRRICPGRHFADASLWIAAASILATMNISKAIGEDGKDMTPKGEYSAGIVSHPLPYQCRIQPRNEAARDLIARVDISESF
ncbi:hypothetical protein Hypma_001219 [Hypsizygus marmoreus]|uniref:O-methylsterigmatocystin oxidoreductase n=1 Tax=Hypsizygus marmoreus TaxID=39966 RepID=A0A369JD67_HYPMA|nr:hypothetical protein Hypma_001219 [Hypsizygus marmoreus]